MTRAAGTVAARCFGIDGSSRLPRERPPARKRMPAYIVVAEAFTPSLVGKASMIGLKPTASSKLELREGRRNWILALRKIQRVTTWTAYSSAPARQMQQLACRAVPT